MNVCVFCAASDDIAPVFFELGETFGRELARRGHTLIFGGGATGIMGAVARGATAGGGKIVGVAPRFFDHDGILYAQCTEMILTETMWERKEQMAALADSFVMLPGGIGTIQEFLEMLVLRQLDRHKKPIAVLDVNGYFDGLFEMLERSQTERFLGENDLDLYVRFTDAVKLLNYLER